MGKLRLVREYYTNPMQFTKPEATPRVRFGELRIEMLPFFDVTGLVEMGEGHFSRVFILNSKWVLKIDCNNSDNAYDEYAKFAMENQHNPWVPRIRARFEFANCKAYIIERLSHVAKSVETERIQDMASKWRGDVLCTDLMLWELIMGFGHNNFNDVAHRNMMRRENGQIVLTDPTSTFFGRGSGSDAWNREQDRMRNRAAEGIAHREKMGFEFGQWHPSPFAPSKPPRPHDHLIDNRQIRRVRI